jgi:hypothetical protein
MTYKVKRKNKMMKNTYAVRNPKKTEKQLFLEDIKKRGTITEREILLIKRRLNNGTYKYDDIQDIEDLKITPSQTQKGLAWLRNKWQTPRGVERKNNPFGYREEDAIENFKEFRLNSFTDIRQSSFAFPNYVPVYDVYSKKGFGFQYYVQGGEPKIIG